MFVSFDWEFVLCELHYMFSAGKNPELETVYYLSQVTLDQKFYFD